MMVSCLCVVFWQQPLLDALTLLPFIIIALQWSSTGPRAKKKADTWVSNLAVIYHQFKLWHQLWTQLLPTKMAS